MLMGYLTPSTAINFNYPLTVVFVLVGSVGVKAVGLGDM